MRVINYLLFEHRVVIITDHLGIFVDVKPREDFNCRGKTIFIRVGVGCASCSSRAGTRWSLKTFFEINFIRR